MHINCWYPLVNVISPVYYAAVCLGIFFIGCGLYRIYFGFTRLSTLGAVFMFAGGAFNAFERISTGCVKDYIPFLGLFWFNLYDTIVVLGTLLIAVSILIRKKE